MPKLTKLSRSVRGEIALVPGAGSGMGRATAHLFADEGARVAVVDVNEDGARTVAQEIVDSGGDAGALPFDLRQAPRIPELVAGVTLP